MRQFAYDLFEACCLLAFMTGIAAVGLALGVAGDQYDRHHAPVAHHHTTR